MGGISPIARCSVGTLRSPELQVLSVNRLSTEILRYDGLGSSVRIWIMSASSAEIEVPLEVGHRVLDLDLVAAARAETVAEQAHG